MKVYKEKYGSSHGKSYSKNYNGKKGSYSKNNRNYNVKKNYGKNGYGKKFDSKPAKKMGLIAKIKAFFGR